MAPFRFKSFGAAGRPMQPGSIGLRLYAEIDLHANNIFLAIINKIQDVGAQRKIRDFEGKINRREKRK
jgi:hypothetical protein